MITKEQALTCDRFVQVYCYTSNHYPHNEVTVPCATINWRRNGKTQTWKTRPDDFKIPIKHGLYSYGYITQDNAALFTIQE